MKIKKSEMKAILDAIEADEEDRTSALLGLRDLRNRVEAPKGPFYLKKQRDGRGHKVWEVDSDRYFDLPESFSRWYYDKDEAKSELARLNIMHRDGEREERVAEESAILRGDLQWRNRQAKAQPTMTLEDAAEEEDLTRKVVR